MTVFSAGKIWYGKWALLGLLAVALAGAFFFSLAFGSVRIPFDEMLRQLFSGGGNDIFGRIIWHVRLPRTLCAAMVGAALAISGTILQCVMRNPLASPGIIGVSAGGGLASMVIMIALPQFFHLLVPAAFAGALLTTLLIYALAWQGGVRPMRLILAGVAVASFLGACSATLMIFYPDKVAGVVDFMVGGLSGRSWNQVSLMWPYVLGGLLLAMLLSRSMNVLALGDECAAGLGLNVEMTRFILITGSSLLAAAAVSVAGLLGFVGLIVPHMTRLLLGSDHRFLLPGATLGAAALLIFCDALGRVVIAPQEIPLGVIMALLGAPFFLYLLHRYFKNEN